MADEEWKSISDAVTRLFELKRYPDLALNLPFLNAKVRVISKSDIGHFLEEYYHNNLMRRCMVSLRLKVEEAKEGGRNLINKLAEVWTQFYTSILPTLLAFFASIQPQQNKLSIRALTLISFRDYVLLKINFSDALGECSMPLPPQIQQMLLVLQSVHQSNPTDNFFALQEIVGQVVDNYFPMVIKTLSKKVDSVDSACEGQSLQEPGRSGRTGMVQWRDHSPTLRSSSELISLDSGHSLEQ